MKKLVIACLLLLGSLSIVQAQKFQKYQTWTSENHQHDDIRQTDKRFHRPKLEHREHVVNYGYTYLLF